MITPAMIAAVIVILGAHAAIALLTVRYFSTPKSIGKVAVHVGHSYQVLKAYKSETGLGYVYINGDLTFVPTDSPAGILYDLNNIARSYRWLTYPTINPPKPQLDEV